MKVHFLLTTPRNSYLLGTAMFKAASTKAETPSDGQFLYLSIDGTTLPSDQYLILAGQLTAKNGG